jgi:histidinol-phosphate phosphatase family protein
MTNQFDTLFLDRDGVINVKIDNEYIVKSSDFEFMPGVLSSIQKLSSIFKRIIIVTNQQGIGKKVMTEQDLAHLHEEMLVEIEQVGGRIDRIYYCPHLVSENCECRKPKSGMIIQAFFDFPDIKSKFSYLIGDSDSDIEAGKQEHLQTVKVDNEYTLSKWCDELFLIIQ